MREEKRHGNLKLVFISESPKFCLAMAGKAAPNSAGVNMDFKEMKGEPNAPHVEYEQIKVKRGMLWIFIAILNLSLHFPFG